LAPCLFVNLIFAMRKVTTCLLALAILILSGHATFAQISIHGKVIDSEDQKPLPGSTVRVGELRGTTSDQNGIFFLSNLPFASGAVQVSYLGYETLQIPIENFNGQTPLVIALQKTVFKADEVVINATRANDKTGMAYSTINAEALNKQNLGQDLPVLLNFTPSMVTTSDAGAGIGYTGMRIRGSDASRINVTINGIPYNDPESQGTFFVNMPDFSSSVSSIQIQRGVGTSTNGAGAFGATVNINTNEFRKEAYAELNNSYGSFNTWKNTVKVGSGLLNDKFTVDARLSKVTSDGFIDRASSDLKSYYLSGAYYGKKTFVRVNATTGKETTYQSWYGTPESRVKGDREGMLAYIERNWLNDRDAQNLLNSDSRTYNYYTYDNQTDNYQQDQFQLISSHTLSNNWTFNLNAFYVRGRGYFEEYRDEDKLSNYLISPVTVGQDTIKNTDLIRRRWLDNHFYGTTFSLDYTSFKKLNLNIGGGWNQYDGDHYGEVIWARFAGASSPGQRYYFNNGLKKDLNLYAKVYYQLTEKLNIFADVQARWVNHLIEGKDNKQLQLDFDRSFFFLNPKIGLTYETSEKSSAYTSLSLASREPNRNDIIEAIPQNQPKAESMLDWEAGYKIQQNTWTISANYYLMSYKNQLVLSGEVNDVGNSIRVNAPNSYRTGIELEGAAVLGKYWKWNANVTLSQNKIKNFTEYVINYDTGGYSTFKHSKSDISFSPNVVSGSQLAFLPCKNVELALLTKYVGKQFLDNTSTNTRKLDAYLTNDIRFNWTLTPNWAKQIRLTALVNNVLNEKYESNGYTYAYIAGGEVRENFYYPQAGRNFLIGVNISF
jgi:iron complex outermembrane receptor protein